MRPDLAASRCLLLPTVTQPSPGFRGSFQGSALSTVHSDKGGGQGGLVQLCQAELLLTLRFHLLPSSFRADL